jgi:hypothetical protein
MYQDYTACPVAKVPGNGKSFADELARRDPQLFVTSAILGDAEAHSHIGGHAQALRSRPRGSDEVLSRSTGSGEMD